MKKILYFAVAALLMAASCAKENNQAPLADKATYTVELKADLSPTKTAYDAQGKFSWVAGDRIGVVVYDESAAAQVVPFTTSESGALVTFTGEVPEGFAITEASQATYPYTEVVDGYSCNDFVYDPAKGGFRLWGSIKPSLTDPLSCTPLLGSTEDCLHFSFITAVGIVKFTVENVPMETAYAYLEVPSGSEASLNGWYAPVDGVITMGGAVESYTTRYNWNVPAEANSTLDYYFFLPVGTLPAGTKFELCNSGWAAIQSFPFTKEVEVVRNAVTNIAPITLDPTTVFKLEDILGEYEMTVTSGSYSSNAAPGDLVLEASDDPTKGNVMMTKFGGVSGKQYGTFNGATIVFPKAQIFGANPYDDAASRPYVGLDFYNGGVVDAEFEVLERGKIQAINAAAMGLRTCTAEEWESFGGGWPWALCYGSIVATWKLPADWKSIGTGRFRDNYIWPFAGLTEYAEVDFQQDANHPTQFRLAKPYPGANADEWLKLDVTDPNAVSSPSYFTDVEITRTYSEATYTFKAYMVNGAYGLNFSKVQKAQSSGLPANIMLGPCYRSETFDGTDYGYEVGMDHDPSGYGFDRGVVEIIFPGCEPYEPDLEDGQVKLKKDMISVNVDCGDRDGNLYDGNGYGALVDSNPETFWHTPYYSASDIAYYKEYGYFTNITGTPYEPNDLDSTYGAYVDIALTTALQNFHFSYYVRHNNNNGRPREVVIAGSHDGSTWNILKTIADDDLMGGATAGARVNLPAVQAGEAYEHLRFGITKAGATPDNLTAKSGSTALGELLLFAD